jgi:hypothetical protein
LKLKVFQIPEEKNMTRVKSAFERAMERADSLGEPSLEDKLRFKFLPQGERLAARFLKGEGDLEQALKEVETEAMPYLVKGIIEVLIHNVSLAKTTVELETNKRILQGMRLVKSDKNTVDEIASRIEYVCNSFQLYYQQGLDRAYQETKDRFQQQAQEILKMQGGLPHDGVVNVEAMPEFRQEWARIATGFLTQYQSSLDEQKALLKDIA